MIASDHKLTEDPMDENQKNLEEFKEAGREYRYRDSLMVTEFGLALTVAALTMNFLASGIVEDDLIDIIFKFLGLGFIAVVSQHLSNINRDRRLALHRKAELGTTLKFHGLHGGLRSSKWKSVPFWMVQVTRLYALGWLVWLVVTVKEVLNL